MGAREKKWQYAAMEGQAQTVLVHCFRVGDPFIDPFVGKKVACKYLIYLTKFKDGGWKEGIKNC